MLLYLVQHAEAMKEEENPERPLSEKGIQDIKKTASYISRLDIMAKQILHSKKLRAKQTAEVLGEILEIQEILETDGLTPLDDPKTWDDHLKYITDDVILVGHLPHLANLASLLLCGDSNKNIVSFMMAGVVCLERDEKALWSLRWMIIPEIIT